MGVGTTYRFAEVPGTSSCVCTICCEQLVREWMAWCARACALGWLEQVACVESGGTTLWGMVKGTERRSFRRTAVRLCLTAMASLFLAAIASGLFAAGPDGSDEPALLQRLVVTPFVILALWITVGLFRQGVWSSPQGISVRNVFSGIPLDGLRLKPLRRRLRMDAGLQIVLKSGRRINAALYAAGPFNRPTFADG